MYINNEDMFVLKSICSVLALDNGRIPSADVNKFESIVDKLETQRAKRISNATKYIKEKRKNDKYYARTHKEKTNLLGI